MDRADVTVAMLRAGHVACLLSLEGVLVFVCLILPAAAAASGAEAARLSRILRRLATISGVLALVIGFCWFAAVSASMASASSREELLAALEPVARETRFGYVMVLRGALIVAVIAALMMRRGRVPALVAAVAAAGTQPWLGHPGAAPQAWLPAASALHVLAAGAWLGGLLPLLFCLHWLPPQAAAVASRRFSPIGVAAVIVLATTATAQGWVLIGSLPGLTATSYGLLALSKAALFATMLILAFVNRQLLTPHLTGIAPQRARRRMMTSVGAETFFGVLVVVAAALLASSTPAAHQSIAFPPSHASHSP
jgi:putative copper resistance protein D